MLAVWQALKNVVLPGYSLTRDAAIQNKKKGTGTIGMRGEEVGLAIKEAIKTIAERGDVKKVTARLKGCTLHLLQCVYV